MQESRSQMVRFHISFRNQPLTVAGAGFRTDADITASTNFSNRGERELRRWEPSHDDPVSMSLEDSSSSAGWDQFAVNEKLFGVKTDFDENIYTTKLDKSHPLYSQREARAAKIAREIESSGGAISAHVAEERGLAYDDSGMDEEDKYGCLPLVSYCH